MLLVNLYILHKISASSISRAVKFLHAPRLEATCAACAAACSVAIRRGHLRAESEGRHRLSRDMESPVTPLKSPLARGLPLGQLSPNVPRLSAATVVPAALRISPSAPVVGAAKHSFSEVERVDFNPTHDSPVHSKSRLRSSEWAPHVTTSHRLSCMHGTTVVTVLLGVVTCVVAWSTDQMVTALHIGHRALRGATGNFWLDCCLWSGTRAAMVLLAVFTTAKISPCAAGSGIPEMKCILAGVDLSPHMMNGSTAIAKFIGLVLMCGAGMPVGREGPLVHIAAIIAMQLLKLKHFQTVSGSEVRTHEVLGAACAVGVTAAFGAPIGGVLFSIEVTTSFFLTSSYWRAFVCSVSGCVVFRLLDTRGWGMESSSLFDLGDVILAPQQREHYFWVLPMHVLLGVVCGLLAAAFIRMAAIFFKVTRPWARLSAVTVESRQQQLPSPRSRLLMMKYRKYLYGGGVALLAGIVEYSIAAGGPSGTPKGGGFMTNGLIHCTYDLMYFETLSNTTASLPTLASLLDSGVGQRGGVGTDSNSSVMTAAGIFQQRTVYNEDWERYTVPGSLLIWCTVKLVLTALTITISAPTGVLAPTIAVGAGLGRLIGEAGLTRLAIEMSGVGFTIPAHQLATAGAAAFAAGVTGTVSVAVIVFELTNNLHLGLPVLVSVLTARFVASQLSDSLYDTMLLLGGLSLPPTGSTDKQLIQVRRVVAGFSPRTPQLLGETFMVQHQIHACYGGGLPPMPPMSPRMFTPNPVTLESPLNVL